MAPVQATPLPAHALLARYAGTGAFADCYVTTVDRPVSHAQFVEAFYTGRLFKLERLLIAGLLRRPSTDAQVQALAAGTLESFAAWRVEARGPDQLLLCDLGGRTRSWLMVAAAPQGGTQLYFGSAVVPRVDRRTGQRHMGATFNVLLGFHKLYSRALLSAARSRLVQR